MNAQETKRRCRALLPDDPRWVETRDLLAWSGSLIHCEGACESFVVWSAEDDIASVVGTPAERAVRRAATDCEEILAFPENTDFVRACLPGHHAELADILRASPNLEPAPEHPCRLLQPGELAHVEDLSDALREELEDAAADELVMAAALHDDNPVAFCYVASETESLWDVSIDTIAHHRRKGFAHSAAAYLMSFMKQRGKTAVWGAARSNVASLRLALKLGFVAVDELWVLSRNGPTRNEDASNRSA